MEQRTIYYGGKIVSKLLHKGDNYNKKSRKPYDVYASLGYKMGIPGAGDTLESFMRESDDIMYHNKLTNKMKRNQTLR